MPNVAVAWLWLSRARPVLRDLYGTMHHVGATTAVLVTTGQLSKAARNWLIGKPIEVWDAPRPGSPWRR
jgi:hypothetical protein